MSRTYRRRTARHAAYWQWQDDLAPPLTPTARDWARFHADGRPKDGRIRYVSSEHPCCDWAEQRMELRAQLRPQRLTDEGPMAVPPLPWRHRWWDYP